MSNFTPPAGQSLFSSSDIQDCAAQGGKGSPRRGFARVRLFRNKKVLIAVASLVVVVVGAGIGYAQMGGTSSASNKALVILANVQRRTLQDTVTLTGTLARKELRNITAVTQGRVTTVNATNGSTANAGDVLFALDGRDAIAEPGTVSFFRALGPGDVGDDVLQLKQILAAAGDNPGPWTPCSHNRRKPPWRSGKPSTTIQMGRPPPPNR